MTPPAPMVAPPLPYHTPARLVIQIHARSLSVSSSELTAESFDSS